MRRKVLPSTRPEGLRAQLRGTSAGATWPLTWIRIAELETPLHPLFLRRKLLLIVHPTTPVSSVLAVESTLLDVPV